MYVLIRLLTWEECRDQHPPPPPPLPPYATLLGFTRYVGRTGPRKATFVGGLRRQRGAGSGFNPHGQLVKALKADIAVPHRRHLPRAIVDVVKPRWRPLYESLVPGALRYLESLGDPSQVESPRPATPSACSAGCP